MRLLEGVRDRLIRRQYRRAARFMETADPKELADSDPRKVLRAFRRAAREVPAYRKLLKERGVRAEGITTLDAFRRHVPILDKHTLFAAGPLRDLCIDGNLDGIGSVYASSGQSGTFSYGVLTRAGTDRAAVGLEFLLDTLLGVLDRRTLYINCNAMGVRVPTRTIVVAETSVRSDTVLALVERLAPEFDRLIINGESPFLKTVVEEGLDRGVPWRDLPVSLITGGEYIAENYRSYLASILGIDLEDPATGLIGVNFGVSELSISLFRESQKTLLIRRLAHEDADFRRSLYGRETRISPSIVQYFPGQFFVETLPGEDGRSELIVTVLDPKAKIPMIRYNTRDVVELMAYEDLADVLRAHGREDLLPRFRLPMGIIWGRGQALQAAEGKRVIPEEVKEALYADHDLAQTVTGSFHLSREADTAALLVQLREGRRPTDESQAKLEEQLHIYVDGELAVRMLPYREFPLGFTRDFQHKCQYVARNEENG